jgi:aminoglycoside phosphotransferase family enzyme/predicted kinase
MDALIGKLRNPALYPHPAASVELLETHISWVLLAGDFAYKIKKPVDFGFLDFSTLSRRRFFCHEELRLNRRLAPDLYLDVIAIAGTEDCPEFNGSGAVIDYAVKMRRFAENALFDRLLAENRLEARHIDALADTVAAFHAAVPRAGADDAHGSAEAIQTAALENFSHIYPLLPAGDDTAGLDALRAWTEKQYEILQPLLQARKTGGFIRECHGDLHLGNIVLIDNRPVPFDAIEFNENLRWIDVISEIAFTVMDLQAKNRTGLAYRLLNRYLAATGDYAGCRLLRYYLVYRGMVRAKIALLGLAQSDDTHGRSALWVRYGQQLRFALDCIRPHTPLLLLCRGFSGCGKSTLAARLAERLPAVHLRSDLERKRLSGLSATADSGSPLQQGIYTPDMTERTYRHLAARAEKLLQGGFSIVADATFLKHWQRDLLRRCAHACAARLVILDVQTGEAVLRKRIEQRLGTRLDTSEATLAVLERQLQEHEPLTAQERLATLPVDGECADGDSLANAIAARLAASA